MSKKFRKIKSWNIEFSSKNFDPEKSWREIIKKYPEANFLQSPKSGKMKVLAGE